VVLVVFGLMLLPSVAGAGSQWRTAQNLSAANAYSPDIAVTPQGTAIAVWVGFDGTSYRVQAAVRPKGGSFGAAQLVSGNNTNTSEPHVAVDPQGNAVAVWARSSTNDLIQAAFRPAGTNTSFGTPQTLSVGGVTAFNPAVSMDPQGNAVATWARGALIEAARRPAGQSSNFGPVATLSAGGTGAYAYEPQVGALPGGDAVAVWTRFDGAPVGAALYVQAAELRVPVYEEPQSAASLQTSLVPVFTPCGTQSNPVNGSHAAPLSVGACNPPAPTPGVIAYVGTLAVGSAQLTVVPGNFNTSANEADVSIGVSSTDVRSGSPTGPDYNPSAGADLTYTVRLRITDSNNGALFTDPATVQEIDFSAPVNCTTTGGAEGANCSASTTANAVTPGSILEGKDMILQVFRGRLTDAGPNGIRGDSDDLLFEQQGVYVP
jgi:hypothetical protein